MRQSLLIIAITLSVSHLSHAQDVHVQVSKEFKFSATDAYHFPTIMNALDHAPDVPPSARLYIHIAPGTYAERVYVSQYRPRTTLVGMGKDPSEVVITAAQNPKSSQSTFFSETMEVLAEDFQADNLTIENTAGPTGQALAVSVTADRAIFKHCRLLGYQDTLFAQYGRQYYTDTYISGAVDFIFGNAAAVFDHSEIRAIGPGYLTAQGRTSADQNTGYVILHSKITHDPIPEGRSLLLGRAWRPYSRVVIMHSQIDGGIDPKGWNNWDKDPEHIWYGEFDNTGEGAKLDGRVPWIHRMTAADAAPFEPRKFLSGNDRWDPEAVAAKMP
jgi:pectinesterase